jgi:hypothetical protein
MSLQVQNNTGTDGIACQVAYSSFGIENLKTKIFIEKIFLAIVFYFAIPNTSLELR